MADGSHDVHPEELQSDLDMLVDMARDAKQDEQVVLRHLEALKEKLDHFVHRNKAGSGSAG